MSSPRIRCALVACSFAALAAGCDIIIQQPPATSDTLAAPADPAPDASQAPLVDGPGVAAIEVEPPPVARVYVYDPGYPPGTYFCGGYYWYGGYYYQRDVFINRVVVMNVRESRFVNAEENRAAGQRLEQRDRAVYAKTGGARPNAAVSDGGQRNKQATETNTKDSKKSKKK